MQNFVVIGVWRDSFTLMHEIMHILLNEGHPRTPVDDPATALFYSGTVATTKRIGPYDGNGSGSNDTFTMRDNAENLP